MILTPGTRLGSYEILAPIGAGGMGEVYRARDLRLDRDVAIKVLPEQFAKDADALLRFEREAKAVAALSHSNILAIHDIGDVKGVHFIGLVNVVNLKAPRCGVRSCARCAPTTSIRRTARCGYGRRRRRTGWSGWCRTRRRPGCCCRSISLTGPGSAVNAPGLADAETQVVHTTPGIVVGTMGYMSPEQLRGELVDGRSDIFSFGCVLYEMVAGQKAFARKTAAESIRQS